MDCAEARPYLQAFVDDELTPERAIEVREHLRACQPCATEVELTRELATATRVSVGESSMCPQFQARLCACLEGERRRQERTVTDPLSFKVIAPLAAAVALAFFFSYGKSPFSSSPVVTPEGEAPRNEDWDRLQMASTAADGQENLVDFLVRTHANGPGSDVTEPVDGLEPQLGFAVRAPDLRRYGARFQGAQLVAVNPRTQTAVLRYEIGGRRVTLYVYNPEEMPLIRHRKLVPRVVGDRAVFVGTSRGYSIATCESHGVGYAVTADLSDDESAELVATLDR
jgi:anti-sigma factor RsiW